MVVIIQELVAAGADVNATNNFGETALMKAKAVKGGKGRGMIISALREAGAEE